MTITEIHDNFIRTSRREYRKRGQKWERPDIKEIAFDISEAQQDIQRKLDILIGSYSISLTAGNNLYTLPSNFGHIKQVIMGDTELEVVSANELVVLQTLEGSPVKVAEYDSGNTKKLLVYPTPGTSTFSTAITVYYSLDTRFYQPSGTTDQDWGDFDGDSFTGKLLLPDRYDKAVNLYLMMQEFDNSKDNNFERLYDKELLSLRSGHSNRAKLNYVQLGKPKYKPFIVGSETVVVSTVNKVLQVSLAQSGTSDPTISYTYQNSWSDAPTIARTATGTYTITITDAFTEGQTFFSVPAVDWAEVGDENRVQLEWTSVSIVTMKVYDSLNQLTDGFDKIDIKIEVAP